MPWIVRSSGKSNMVTVAPPGAEPFAMTYLEAMALGRDLLETAEVVRRGSLAEAYGTPEEAEAALKAAEGRDGKA